MRTLITIRIARDLGTTYRRAYPPQPSETMSRVYVVIRARLDLLSVVRLSDEGFTLMMTEAGTAIFVGYDAGSGVETARARALARALEAHGITAEVCFALELEAA